MPWDKKNRSRLPQIKSPGKKNPDIFSLSTYRKSLGSLYCQRLNLFSIKNSQGFLWNINSDIIIHGKPPDYLLGELAMDWPFLAWPCITQAERLCLSLLILSKLNEGRSIWPTNWSIWFDRSVFNWPVHTTSSS